jgi:hypothetical protein
VPRHQQPRGQALSPRFRGKDDCGGQQVFAAAPNKFQLLSLYMQRTNRDMQKTLDRLTALQTDRKARRQDALEEAALLYELAEENRAAEDPDMSTGQALSREMQDQRREVEVSGFVFSIHQIQARVIRKRQLARKGITVLPKSIHHQSKHKTHKNEFVDAA